MMESINEIPPKLSTEYSVTDLNVEEDQAESVDSGCVPDLTLETTLDQVHASLNYEYNFALGLLQHTTQHKSQFFKDEGPKASTSTKSCPPKIQSTECNKTNIQTSNQECNNLENKPVNNIKGERKMLEEELRKLRKKKISNMTMSQAKQREGKIRKKLTIMDKQQKKEIKRQKKKERIAIDTEKTVEEAQVMDKKQKKELKRKKKQRIAIDTENMAEEAKKIYNKCGKLVFSKFDFSDNVKEKWIENKKPDLNNFLSKVLKEKEKIKTLKSHGKVDKAADFMENNAWADAMKKAEGIKVKDCSEKLTRSLQKKKNQKKKSKAKWSERERMVEKSKEVRKEKKKQNVVARKQKQSLRGKGKAKKKKIKGNRVPGF